MIMLILMIFMTWIGVKFLITPAERLVQQYPKMPSIKWARIGGGFIVIVGIAYVVFQILVWLKVI